MTVYVVQDQRRFDHKTNALVPKYPDLAEKASEHGDVCFLLSPSAGPWNVESIVRDLRRGLETFSDADSLLLIGNPVIIMLAGIVASQVNGGRVASLQWSGKDQRYIRVDAQVFPSDRTRRRDKLSPDRIRATES